MGFYQKIFASMYDKFMGNIETEFGQLRKEMLSDLKGNILDVGSGTGANFKYFNKDANVIAVEPSPFMLEKSKAKLPQKATIKTYNLSVTDPKLDEIIQPKSLDYVVSTLVLCTIPDYKLALKKFQHWLKDDGKLIVIEHIHAKEKPRRVIQNVINPAWKVIGDGCNLNRDTDKVIKAMGFKPLKEEYFKRSLRFYKGMFEKT
jgi:ubiquinone/menaquinone biosynthesis C-methylase UbiE